MWLGCCVFNHLVIHSQINEVILLSGFALLDIKRDVQNKLVTRSISGPVIFPAQETQSQQRMISCSAAAPGPPTIGGARRRPSPCSSDDWRKLSASFLQPSEEPRSLRSSLVCGWGLWALCLRPPPSPAPEAFVSLVPPQISHWHAIQTSLV